MGVRSNKKNIVALACLLLILSGCGSGGSTSGNGGGVVTPSQYNITATDLSSSSMQLTWSSISGAAGYWVLRADWGYRSSVTGGILTYTDTGLSPNTQYCYYVQAYDVWGNGLAMSNPACATTKSNVRVGQYTSLRVDDYGDLFVAYYDQTNKIVKYATAGENYPTQWNILSSPNELEGITDISLAIDPYNVYSQYVLVGSNYLLGGAVALSNRTSGGWGGYTNLAYPSWVGNAKLAMDSGKNLHVAYYDASLKCLVYMTNWYGIWNSFTIDTSGVGNYTSIAVDSSAKAQISYYDATNGYLKLAVQIFPGSYNAWNTYVIDSIGNVGQFTSIAIDSAGKTHISYYDAGNSWLKYATNTSGAWNTYMIDNSPNVGMYSSIAVDSNGNAHMSYYDATNKTLKYATNISGVWVAITVDSSADVGLYSSIGVDSQGKVHISYYDQTNGYLKYASNYFGQWNTYIIDGL
jgi:hypothetical protein